MSSTTEETVVTEVRNEGGRQSVLLPAEFHLTKDRVFLRRDPTTGVVQISEQPFQPTLQQVFQMFDELDLSGFEMERDHSLPREVDL